MKTKTTLLILCTIMVLPVFNSCKKGEGDPFLSLSSRKARVVGEWVIDQIISDISIKYYDSDGDSYNDHITSEIDENDFTENVEDAYNASGKVEAKIVFEKDGTFKRTIKHTNIIVIYDNIKYTSTLNMNREETGTWNFLCDIEDDFKDKERLILNILEVFDEYRQEDSDGSIYEDTDNESYGNGIKSEIWTLLTLSNKELAFEYSQDSYINSASTIIWNLYGINESYSYTEEVEGMVEGTLIQE